MRRLAYPTKAHSSLIKSLGSLTRTRILESPMASSKCCIVADTILIAISLILTFIGVLGIPTTDAGLTASTAMAAASAKVASTTLAGHYTMIGFCNTADSQLLGGFDQCYKWKDVDCGSDSSDPGTKICNANKSMGPAMAAFVSLAFGILLIKLAVVGIMCCLDATRLTAIVNLAFSTVITALLFVVVVAYGSSMYPGEWMKEQMSALPNAASMSDFKAGFGPAFVCLVFAMIIAAVSSALSVAVMALKPQDNELPPAKDVEQGKP